MRNQRCKGIDAVHTDWLLENHPGWRKVDNESEGTNKRYLAQLQLMQWHLSYFFFHFVIIEPYYIWFYYREPESKNIWCHLKNLYLLSIHILFSQWLIFELMLIGSGVQLKNHRTCNWRTKACRFLWKIKGL